MVAKIAIINSSPTAYNLATDKMQAEFLRQGHQVLFSHRADMWAHQCQKAYLSAIFTWDLPLLVQDAESLARLALIDVEVGGPAVTAIAGICQRESR